MKWVLILELHIIFSSFSSLFSWASFPFSSLFFLILLCAFFIVLSVPRTFVSLLPCGLFYSLLHLYPLLLNYPHLKIKMKRILIIFWAFLGLDFLLHLRFYFYLLFLSWHAHTSWNLGPLVVFQITIFKLFIRECLLSSGEFWFC